MRTIPARPTETQQLRLHVPTHWIFAFRIALPEFRVTGIVGPLNGPEWRLTQIETLDYDEDPERLAWANENLREFELTG